MEECELCKIVGGKRKPILIKENEFAVAISGGFFREGHCVVVLKKHKLSISEIEPKEYDALFDLITQTSKALEIKYDAEKTYLISIGDKIGHLHFHLIPKHKDLCSMGDYCFLKMHESEGERHPKKSEQITLAEDVKKIMGI